MNSPFYSEREIYYRYYEGYIHYVLDNSDLDVCYLTSDTRDPLLAGANPRIKAFYINHLLATAIQHLDSKVLVMTMPDLGLYHVKKSRNSVNHVYLFHAVGSTHLQYQKRAFDAYDTVFCIGPYDRDELRRAESLYRLPEKQLLECGYSWIDRIFQDHQAWRHDDGPAGEETNILVAPSWHDGNILEFCVDDLIAALEDSAYRVTFRPHPEFIKRKWPVVRRLRDRLRGIAHMDLELDMLSGTSLHQADVLIIDSPHPNVALLDRFRGGMDGTVVSVADGVITNIFPPHLQTSNFDFSDKYKTLNVYKFSEEFCEQHFKELLRYYSAAIDDNCYYELILDILIHLRQEVIAAEILDDEHWSEVDDPNDLRVSEFIFDTDNRIKILEATRGGYWSHDIVDFGFIRNMYFPNNSMLSALESNLVSLMRNYGSRQEVLNQKLAFFLQCQPEQVTLLNGASQVYPVLRSRFGKARALLPAPTFGEYARVFESFETYSDKVGVDAAEIVAKAAGCAFVVFVNPNNPTGTLLDTEWIYRFAADNRDRTIIVDESFIDFSTSVSVFELLETEPLDNVVVLKSLSKSLGVPGVRLGYAYSHNREMNQLVRESIPIWNSNSVAEFLLEIILKHRASLAGSFHRTIQDRESFSRQLTGETFVETVHPSGGNFVLVEFKRGRRLDQLASWLIASKSVYVRDVSSRFGDGRSYLRLALRLPEENGQLVESLREYFETTVG